MADRGFVRLGDCEPGTLVEPVAFQTQWLFTGFVRPDDGTGETHELYGVGADEVIHLPADALVYPLTAVRLHPSLAGSDLWGLVRAWAAEPGDVTAGVLLDWLAEAAGRVPTGSRWRHRKGGLYHVCGVALEERTLQPVVVYRTADKGKFLLPWTRPLGEFLDGRFTREEEPTR